MVVVSSAVVSLVYVDGVSVTVPVAESVVISIEAIESIDVVWVCVSARPMRLISRANRLNILPAMMNLFGLGGGLDRCRKGVKASFMPELFVYFPWLKGTRYC